jgi:hypothetical protein
MTSIKTLLLFLCFSVSQSFAGHQKQNTKPFTKSIAHLDEEANPKFYAAMITKILIELKNATPQGYHFCSTTAIQHILNDSDKPFYIKIEK